MTATVRLSLDPTLDDVTDGFFDGTQESPATVHAQAEDAEVRALVRRRSHELVAEALAAGPV